MIVVFPIKYFRNNKTILSYPKSGLILHCFRRYVVQLNTRWHHYSHCSSLRCSLEGTILCTSIPTLALQRRNVAPDPTPPAATLYAKCLYKCYCLRQNSTNSGLFLLAPSQTRHQYPHHAEQHAGSVGEDELQLAGPGSLPLDPRSPSPLPRQGF